jgi:glycogen debranching enzyme
LSVDLTNFDTGTQPDIPRGTVYLYRSKFLDEGICYEQFRLTNYGLTPVKFSLSFEFGADFTDIFEVRGTERHQKGRFQSTRVESDKVALNYLGLDSVFRSTCVNFSPAPAALSDSSASYDVRLASKQESTISVTVVCERSSAARPTLPYKEALTARNAQCQEELFGGCKIRTSSKPFNAWLARAEADLRMLIQGNPEGAYPYAGVPWFNTVFGRDGIITAMECLWMHPGIAEGVLNYLALTQATESNAEQDAEPGKIVHEVRRGEMAALKEVPFGKYYGSVDATPLFVLLAGGYFVRTNNLGFLKTIWPNMVRALEWIDRYGDADGDGFVEYSRRSAEGLSNQG